MVKGRIVTVGEVVWDCFPDRRVLGGAPVNVAYQLGQLGVEATVVTRIGSDGLAEETLRRLTELGVSVAGVQRDPSLPTGRVEVTIGADHEPSFDIVAPAAWDAISFAPADDLLGGKPFTLIYGTLAQRDPRSREAIGWLRRRAAARFYDVNLRPPFTTPELVLASLADADLVKMNGDELRRVGGWAAIDATEKKMVAKELLKKYNVTVLAVTEGKNGAWLMAGDRCYEHPGFPVEVVDTVGAGDAFFATLIEGYLRTRPPAECLERANRRGSYVAGRHGATPPMPPL
ncbi:MAG: carbohydrate kinase [Desulfobulbaceae bacterium]|nr:carbohydrate kinase [Desulfobulbaceae bacterium]